MKGRFRCLGLIAIGMSAASVPAEAKSVHLGEYSRNSIEVSCARAGGRSFGTKEDAAEYGCRGPQASIVCTPDADCFAFVADMMPITGNSLDAILGIRRSGQPHKVKAVDSRIQP